MSNYSNLYPAHGAPNWDSALNSIIDDVDARVTAAQAAADAATAVAAAAVPGSAIGNTVASLDPILKTIPTGQLPVTPTFTTRDLGNLTGINTIDVSLTSDFTFTLIGNVTLTFLAPAGWKGRWSMRVKQDATGGRTLTLPNVNRTPSHAAIPVASGANAETEYGFVSRDGSLLTIACTVYAPDTLSVTTFDTAVLALSPTAYWKLTETSGTSFADSSVGSPAAATLAGSGGTLANAFNVIPSDPTSVGFQSKGTAYITTTKQVTTTASGWSLQLLVGNEDAGWPDFRIYSEGNSTDTTHLNPMFTVGSAKYNTQNMRLVLRTTNGGASVNDLVGPDECVNTPPVFDGFPHLLHITYAVSGGTYTLKVYLDGNNTETYTGTLAGTYTVNRTTIGALGRDVVNALCETNYGRVAQFNTTLTAAQITALASAWRGGTAVPKRTRLSGAYRDGVTLTNLNTYGAARGRAVDMEMFFEGPDNATWAQIQAAGGVNNTYDVPQFQGTNSAKLLFSVNMLPGDSTQTLAVGATGAYNSNFVTLATNLVNRNFGYARVRLGWEQDVAYFNSSYFNTRVTTSLAQAKADYRTYWQQIVTAMRSVSGAHFTFIWNPQCVSYQSELSYPGDNYVDEIGLDLYNYLYQSNSPIQTPSDPNVRWQKICTGNGNNGLNFWIRYARAGATRLDNSSGAGASTTSTVAKPLCHPEWATANPEWQNGSGGGDDAMFMNNMFSHFRSHNVSFESYYEHNTSGTAGSPGVAGNQGPYHALFQSGTNQYGYSAAKTAYLNNVNL